MDSPRSFHLVALVAAVVLIIWAPGTTLADGDAAHFQRLGFDDLEGYCLFQETIALRGEYAPTLGLQFLGPDDRDGGGVLSTCAFFLVTGITPPNFMGFNAAAQYSDGGIPRDPQTILFQQTVGFVKLQVGAGIEVGYPATLTAFDAAGQVLSSQTVPLAQETVPLLVEAAGTARVELEAPGARYIMDDLLWGESAGNDLRLALDQLAITLAAGDSATVTVDVVNQASAELSFFVQERDQARRSGVRAPGRLEPVEELVDPANRPHGPPPRPLALSRPDHRDGPPALLVYTEIDPNGTTADTDLDQALRSLDIPYTAVYAAIGFFREQLASGTWDAVIFDHQLATIYPYDFVLFDELNAYVEQGGRLFMSSWQMADVPDHPLWDRLGVRWVASYESPVPVAWTTAAARWVDVPNDVPRFAQLSDLYIIDGHRLVAAPGTTVLARLDDRAGGDALVLANAGRTLVRSFLDGANVTDRDQDDVLDAIELWRGVLVNWLGADVPWLAATDEAMVPAGGSVPLVATFRSAGLSPGRHDAALELRSDEAVHHTYSLPVSLTVVDDLTPAPDAATGLAVVARPNPFNPRTEVQFVLPGSSSTTLRIYSPQGRLVRTLLDGQWRDAGAHVAVWDGRDARGRAVAAGSYLAVVSTPDARAAVRLTLVR